MTDFSNHISRALQEDIGDGDHSALSCIPENAESSAVIICKDSGIISGLEVAKSVFKQVDSSLSVELQTTDGQKVEHGVYLMKVSGKARAILTAERLALNYLQRMSGIATETSKYVSAIVGTKAKVLDTRKTTPGMRVFEKLAVKHGGGENHRFGLYDMIMLKDNHIDFAGSIEKAIAKAVSYREEKGLDVGIEAEARNMEEVKEILKHEGVQRIMLDNFSIADTKAAVALIDGRTEVESSGGINLNTIRGYAECGVDYISVGALTHQIKSLDISLVAE